MKALVLAVVMFACGGPAKPVDNKPADTKPGPAPTAQGEASLEDVALRWAQAALGGNRAEALALSLTHAQLVELTTKEVSKAELDEELTSLLDGLAREGKENSTAKVVAAKVVQRKTLPASEKRKHAVEVAAVQMVIEQDGEQREAGPPMFFVHTDAGWRFTPKK